MNNANQTTLAGTDRERLQQAAELLLQARRTLEPLDDLPAALQPKSVEEAYFVQDWIAAALGPIGGWKVGAPTPDASPLCAPMPQAGFGPSGETVAKAFRRLRGVETEIAYLLGRDLPPRATPYTRQEVLAAIASCHPAIELLESAFLDPDKANRLCTVADLQSHGGFVFGEPIHDWQTLDLGTETARMSVDGFVRVAEGRNLAGSDLVRLVVWLANEGQDRTGGLRAGQWITTGSWTGKVLADSGSVATGRFTSCGEVTVSFE